MRPSRALDAYFEHIVNLFATVGTARLTDRRAVALEGASHGALKLHVEYVGIGLTVLLYADVSYGYPVWIIYRIHVQRSDGTLLFRYDNARHHPELDTFPHHKHVGADERVVPAEQPSIHRVANELATHLNLSS